MKSNLLRLVSLLLCLGMILCTVGCGGDASTNKKKKKKKIIVKKNPTTSDVTDDIGDATSGVFSTFVESTSSTSSETSTAEKTYAEGVVGIKKEQKDYTVNGTPLAYLTTADSSTRFQKQTGHVKVFDKADTAAVNNYVSGLSGRTLTMKTDPNTTYQSIQGFGASMTQASVYNMEIMPENAREKLMTRLFDPENGIGLSILRQPIGCGDFNYLYYSYDDAVPEWDPNDPTKRASDMELANFDFSKEVSYKCLSADNNVIDIGIIPYLNWAQKLNPDLMFVGSVWTPPRWMKTNYTWDSTNGSMLRLDCYDVYSKYIVKSLNAFKDHGVDFYMITPQNELTAKHGIPATYYDSDAIGKLVNQYLYDDLKASGLKTKLFAWDFNWFEDDILLNIGAQYGKIDGVAMHFYANESAVMGTVHDMFPDLEIFLTEAAGNTTGGQTGQLFRQMLYMHQCFRYGTSSWILWNICLEQPNTRTNSKSYYGPGANDGAPLNINAAERGFPVNSDDESQLGTCGISGTGLTSYNSYSNELSYGMDFYVLAHFSKFIHRGAKVFESTDLNAENLLFYNVTAVNEDGTVAIVIGNEGVKSANIVIEFGDKVIVYNDLPGSSVLTLAWDANTYVA